MFWNKKKPKSKPQIKTTVPKTFKAKGRLTSYLERVMTNEEKIFYSKRAVYVRHQRAL